MDRKFKLIVLSLLVAMIWPPPSAGLADEVQKVERQVHVNGASLVVPDYCRTIRSTYEVFECSDQVSSPASYTTILLSSFPYFRLSAAQPWMDLTAKDDRKLLLDGAEKFSRTGMEDEGYKLLSFTARKLWWHELPKGAEACRQFEKHETLPARPSGTLNILKVELHCVNIIDEDTALNTTVISSHSFIPEYGGEAPENFMKLSRKLFKHFEIGAWGDGLDP